jgi:hypothetical protein
VRAKPPSQVDRLADVERPVVSVFQYVDAWRRGRSAANAFARAAPLVAPILDHQRLRHESLREFGRRAANAEHLGRQSLMIDGVTHLGETGEKAISKKRSSRSTAACAEFAENSGSACPARSAVTVSSH